MRKGRSPKSDVRSWKLEVTGSETVYGLWGAGREEEGGDRTAVRAFAGEGVGLIAEVGEFARLDRLPLPGKRL